VIASYHPIAPEEVMVRVLTLADVPGAASLHRLVFADYFLGRMSQRFVELFYEQFVDQRGSYGLVAEAEGRIVGAVIGTVDPAALYSDFYRRHFLVLARLLVSRALTDRVVRRQALDRLPGVISVARSPLWTRRPTGGHASSPLVPPRAARLLSIGVAADYRGSGVAEELVEAFCRRLADDGVERVGLSVFNDNLRAAAFYEKTGWTRSHVGATSTTFTRATTADDPPG
jgi:ribosomal protein S18 acetylase RimI-like enzyme